jgi:hypothetical protein
MQDNLQQLLMCNSRMLLRELLRLTSSIVLPDKLSLSVVSPLKDPSKKQNQLIYF